VGEHTREIQIAGRNRWYRGYISVDSQWNVNDTTTRLRVTAAIDDKYAAEYGTHYDVVVNGSVRSSRDVVLNNYGNWATRDAVTFDVDVPRGASGWNCPVQVHVYGKTYNNYYGSAAATRGLPCTHGCRSAATRSRIRPRTASCSACPTRRRR
jgi:hypothetical protein